MYTVFDLYEERVALEIDNRREVVRNRFAVGHYQPGWFLRERVHRHWRKVDAHCLRRLHVYAFGLLPRNEGCPRTKVRGSFGESLISYDSYQLARHLIIDLSDATVRAALAHCVSLSGNFILCPYDRTGPSRDLRSDQACKFAHISAQLSKTADEEIFCLLDKSRR